MVICVYDEKAWKEKISSREKLFEIQEKNMLNSGLNPESLRYSLESVELLDFEDLPLELQEEVQKVIEKCKNIENFGEVEFCHLTSRCLNQYSEGKIKVVEGYMFVDRTRQTVHHSAAKIGDYCFDLLGHLNKIFANFGVSGDYRAYELSDRDLEIYYSNKLPSFFLKIDDV